MKTAFLSRDGFVRKASVPNKTVWHGAKASGPAPSGRKKVLVQNATILRKTGNIEAGKIYHSHKLGYTLSDGSSVSKVGNGLSFWQEI
jgi:hypothetical protein